MVSVIAPEEGSLQGGKHGGQALVQVVRSIKSYVVQLLTVGPPGVHHKPSAGHDVCEGEGGTRAKLRANFE